MSTTTAAARSRRPRGSGIRGREAVAGWLFVAPVLVILGVFLVLPVIMAAWVSVSDWTGRGSPFASSVGFVGAKNYQSLLTDGGLNAQDFGTAMRNNLWYVLLVVPIQTVVSLFLAVAVRKNPRPRRILRLTMTARKSETTVWIGTTSSTYQVLFRMAVPKSWVESPPSTMRLE